MLRGGARALTFVLALAGAVATLFTSGPVARACGGFFCSNRPIDQAGENILFALAEGEITAHIQIKYAGSAADFAWVVPVQAQPTVSLGSDRLFSVLAQQTNPQFYVEWREEGVCKDDMLYELADANGGPQATAGAGSPPSPGVEVISQEAVGPYDTAVLRANDPQALLAWLNDNGFRIPEQTGTLLVPYVKPDSYFVALKLQQDRGVGELQPVVLKFQSTEPCVPIVLTSIAAQANMPITVWFLAETRAVPKNYRHVLINEALVNWFTGGSNYNQVVSSAVDEAGGRAFVTEFAGPHGGLDAPLAGPFNIDRLRTLQNPTDFLRELRNQGFVGDAQLLGMLRRYIPMPQSLRDQGLDERSFYNGLFFGQYQDAIANQPFDPAAFAAEIDRVIVTPVREAATLFQRLPYLTRLYTTMDPSEMTEDPIFGFNTDLGNVSNIHRAVAVRECGAGRDRSQAPVRLILPDGRIILYPSSPYPTCTISGCTQGASGYELGPSAAVIQQLGEQGPPQIVSDRSGEIAIAVEQHNEQVRKLFNCGCAAGPESGAAGAVGVVILFATALALALRPRRKRGGRPR